MIFNLKNKTLKVSCLMVTKGRPELIKKSVDCYLRQTYPNRELIILSQGLPEENAAIVKLIDGRSDIFFYEAPQSICLGEMRNASIELSQGDVICQWDDDDLYHSRRIEDQYSLMTLSDSFVGCCYNQFLKYFSNTNEMYWCDWSGEGYERQFLCGTIMFYKRLYHEYGGWFYPEEGNQCHVEEDLNVMDKLMSHGTLAAINKGHQYIYVYHGENTYNIDHHNLAIDVSGRKRVMNSREIARHRPLIDETFSEIGLSEVNWVDR